MVADLSDYRELYLEELEEQLQCIEEEVLHLEDEGATDIAIDRLFRAAHTLKGSSAAMGYHKMKDVTHQIEHLLHQVRNGELQVTKPLINLIFTGLDVMKELQGEILRTNTEASEISPLLLKFEQFRQESAPEVHSFEAALLKEHPPDAFIAHVKQAVQMGKRVYLVTVSLEQDTLMQHPRLHLIETKLKEQGTVIGSTPLDWRSLKEEELSKVTWILASSEENKAEVHRIISSMLDVERVEVVPYSSIDIPEEKQALIPAYADHANHPDQSASSQNAPHSLKSKSQTIRVNLERLDHLMNLAGELVIDQTRVQQLKTLFRQKFGPDDLVEELSMLSDHLSLLVSELQDGVMKARMLPIEQLYNRFPRMVRDLADSLEKQVELVLLGKDTELDRTLIEEIGDPLIHLLRNAVDHGIEAPEQRRLNGKNECGTVTLSAVHQDNHVVISIRDDGAGIDADKLRKSAVSKGLLSEEEARRLSDEEAVHLVFKPGFSTAAQISDVSGRGVGMDIVRNDIERMSGMIDIETAKGQGTLFRIRLPLTLAIVTGLLVELSDRTFIIPMSSVAEITRIESKEIKKLRGEPVIKIRNQVIPVVWLHHHFGYPCPVNRQYVPMVIIGRGEKRIALAVDHLLGNQEIVIKSLGRFIGKIDGISGATILGSGNVALILDVDGIIKMLGSI